MSLRSKGGKKTNDFVHSYTSGEDKLYDQELIAYDIRGSIAHAEMLSSVGLISVSDGEKLIQGLTELLFLYKKGDFKIAEEDEDMHTAIENCLVEQLGDVGKKIHTGRSRNDQILVVMRLFMKDFMSHREQELTGLLAIFDAAIGKSGDNLMPGYTHMQRAMPTRVGVWLLSYCDGLSDLLSLHKGYVDLIDQNPLGSLAGFGDPCLGIDREITTKNLGFRHIQENPLYCAMSRGFFESQILGYLGGYMFLFSKIACDLLLFTTKEFNFFSLPDSFLH